MNRHVHVWLMCAEHVYMFVEMSFLSYMTVDRMMDHFFSLTEGHCKPFWCDASMGYSLCEKQTYFYMEKDVRGAVSYGYVLCTPGFLFLVDLASFLIHSNHVYKHISRALWWYNFWTKEELCYSYHLHQMSNLHEKGKMTIYRITKVCDSLLDWNRPSWRF